MGLGRLIGKLWSHGRALSMLPRELDDLRVLAARLLINQMKSSRTYDDIHNVEFKVFSQFGDDGIIQYLVHKTHISAAERCFIEFGVENYEESNTRFLLINDNWRGFVIDGDPRNKRYIMSDHIYWRHDLKAVCAFVDTENINELITSAGFSGEIGLLSIDIDGNDYWVWERISCVKPVVVVVEYNSVLGCEHAVSIPYDPKFRRSTAHYSNLYWGCSIKALEKLAENKGYALVGSNSAGNNAYFIRRERLSDIRELDAQEAYVESRFRESRDRAGSLTFLSGNERLRAIRDMPICDLERNVTVPISELYRC